MPQMELPFFPEGVAYVTHLPAFRKGEGRVVDFNGSMPVFVRTVPIDPSRLDAPDCEYRPVSSGASLSRGGQRTSDSPGPQPVSSPGADARSDRDESSLAIVSDG